MSYCLHKDHNIFIGLLSAVFVGLATGTRHKGKVVNSMCALLCYVVCASVCNLLAPDDILFVHHVVSLLMSAFSAIVREAYEGKSSLYDFFLDVICTSLIGSYCGGGLAFILSMFYNYLLQLI